MGVAVPARGWLAVTGADRSPGCVSAQHRSSDSHVQELASGRVFSAVAWTRVQFVSILGRTIHSEAAGTRSSVGPPIPKVLPGSPGCFVRSGGRLTTIPDLPTL